MTGKTPIMVLQEYAVKHSETPIYNFLEQTTPGEFQCNVHICQRFAVGKARTKKEAKQLAAELMLKKLQSAGKYTPTPDLNYSLPKDKVQSTEAVIPTNNVGKLQDMCVEYSMSSPEYDLLSESGPPHSKIFTVKCKVASIEQTAMASTKKNARQLAAGKVLEYFSTHAPKRITDIEEQEAQIARMSDVAAEKYNNMDNPTTWRPKLGQVISEYHLAFSNSLSKEQREDLERRLPETGLDPIVKCESILESLELSFTWTTLPSKNATIIRCLNVPHANPPICMIALGKTDLEAKRKAADDLIKYIITVL